MTSKRQALSTASGLLAPSALLSSRWSRDNLITPEIARLYTGAISRRVGVEELELHLARLSERSGPLEVEMGSLGVLSWNVRCLRGGRRSLLLLPLVKDVEGSGGRSRCRVPERAFENARHFRRRKLDRYLLTPEQLFEVEGIGRGASFSLPAGYSTLTFGLGSAHVDLIDGEGAWVVCLGSEATDQLTTELLAALAYHYDPSDGTAITDVLVNDGDFMVKRDAGGTFEVRLTCARRVERGIDPNRFLLLLIQLMAYEDWTIDRDLIGLPVSISSPSLAFAGFVRGTAQRYQDLGQGLQAGLDAAHGALAAFARSRDGRAYAPWVGRFLAGSNEELGDEPRRPWWNLAELEQRRDLLRLREGEERALPLATLIERLEEAVGKGTLSAVEEGALAVNDLGAAGVDAFLAERGLTGAARAVWFAGWPYRDERDLRTRVDGLALDTAPFASPLHFGVTSGEEEGTLAALDRLPLRRPPRQLANPEIYGGKRVAPELCQELAQLLPSFESFMDDVLHDARFGYYAHRVLIGRGGHFSTHPEDLTPHYGRFVANWAFEVRRCLLQAGKLTAEDTFPIIEFGAGNGRLARDVLDAVSELSARDPEWQSFGQRLDYRIYELSAALRKKQEALLGSAVQVCPGDARHPGQALSLDFPAGVVGLVVSNELPDAFGVHKVFLSAAGEAEAVLVVPRVEAALVLELPEGLRAAVHAADALLRARLPMLEAPGELLLDRTAFGEVMALLYERPEPERDAGIDRVWFEEVLVPAAVFEPLARVLGDGADEYARALELEDSGVVVYVNVHGVDFIRQVGSALASGQILTIDYGDTTLGLVQGARRGKFPLRIYCDEGDYQPRPNHPYTRPGGQDITADVNFSDLGLAGLGAKLELSYYGPERAIAGAELPVVLRSTDQKPFANFVSNPVFKVLALGRDARFAPEGRGLEPLPLFSEPLPLPLEREERRLSIRARLEGLRRGCKSPLTSNGTPTQAGDGGES